MSSTSIPTTTTIKQLRVNIKLNGRKKTDADKKKIGSLRRSWHNKRRRSRSELKRRDEGWRLRRRRESWRRPKGLMRPICRRRNDRRVKESRKLWRLRSPEKRLKRSLVAQTKRQVIIIEKININ
jgi:hypothetical protein